MTTLLLQKTDKGRAELSPGVRTLSLRERSLLLMANGRQTVAAMGTVCGNDTAELALRLLAQGYLEPVPVPAPPTPAALRSVAAPADDGARGSDRFEGRRSLATARMFLFDLCERLFARRDPALAERLREALRQARDRDTMLAAARALLDAVEQTAGFERADAISERLAMLLPPETADISG